MRLGSEEPPTLLNSSLPIKVPSQPSPSLPPSPTPLARSPPSGIPLNFGRPSSNLQRQPSIKANAAFSRLRIGSFGNPNSSSSSSSSPNSNSEETNTRTLSPDSVSRDSSPRPQHERNNSAPPTSAMGMSPAASFLSSFGTPSPPTPQYSTTSNYARRVVQIGNGGRGSSFGLLPLKGDQEGFVLPRFNLESESEEEGEWRLGKELGSGGMGLVRECIWRGGTDDEKKKKKKRKKLAVKIVRKDLFNGNGSAGGNGSVVDAFGFTAGGASQGRPLPGSRSSSFQHPNSTSNSNLGLGLRNPSKDRLLGGGGSQGFLERNRSTSSPIQPPSNLFPPNSSSSSTTSNGGSLSPIEQSPLPSPGLDSDNHHHHHQRERQEEVKEPPSLLEALLQRELSLWSQISSPRPSHPNLVPLLGMTETLEFTYVFMPLCDGGTLLSYLNSDPLERDSPPVDVEEEEEEDVAVETEGEESSSKSRSRSKGRGLRGRNTLPRVRLRGSLPFASSISPSAASGSGSGSSISTSRRSSRFLSPPPKPQEKALGLEQAGRVFEDIVEGLRWLHEEKRVVHKDFKLENLLASWEEEEEVTSEEEEEREGMELELELERGRAAAVRKKKRKLLKRVWKVADFGLSEIIPPLQAQSMTTLNRKNKTLQVVSGVQPLSSLSRVSSLSRPHGPHQNNNSSSSLSHSVGPSHTKPHHSQSLLLPRTQPTPPSPDLSTHLHPIGSLPYSSPESLKSPIPILDPSVDIWALGCVLYAIVEGKLPIWDEWEFRLRTRLVKGEWEIPDNLKGDDDGNGEKGMVLEVLKGCLERDVRERWDIGRIAKCDWLRFCRERREERKKDKEKKNQLSVQSQSQFDVDMQQLDSSNSISLGSPPSRGRTTQRPLPPPILSSFSSTASSSAASTSTSRSSSRSLSRPNRPSPVSHESPLPSTMRRPSRSTSRSSAYAHQGVDSMTKQEELRERGRSQRRLRWDEEKETSRVRRRSESRDAFEGVMEETLGGGGQRRGRSSSRGSNQTGASGGKSRDRGDTGERLETVGEPY